MRHCPGCGYLVPDGWETCKRCDSALEGATTVARAPVAVGAPAAPGRSSVVDAPPRPASRPAPVGPAARPAPPPIPIGDVVPAGNGNPIRLASMQTASTSLEPTRTSRASRSRERRVPSAAIDALGWGVLVILCAVGAWFARDAFTGSSLPSEVAAYEAGSVGVAHHSDAGRYRAVLPAAPVETVRGVGPDGSQLQVHEATSTTEDLTIALSFVDLPTAAIESPLDTMHRAAQGAVSTVGGVLTEELRASHQGLPALDVRAETPGGDGRLRLVLADNRLYSVILVSELDGAPGFDRLVGSLEIDV